MKKMVWFPFLILLLIPQRAFPEEMSGVPSETFSLLSEEKMVITPSRHLQAVDHSPSTISVITSDEIRDSGAATIPDLLRRVPGMEVMETTSAEHLVSIRGDNQLLANKLLVLIDGRTVHEEFENIVFWNSFPIGLQEIDRIEIIRGPGSAIWGANAFDGVVNIISKSPSQLKGTHLSVSGGEKGYSRGSIVHAGENGSNDYKISFGFHNENEWRESNALGQEVYWSNLLFEHYFDSEKKVTLSSGMTYMPRYDGPLLDNGVGDSEIRQGYLQTGYEDSASFFRLYWNTFNMEWDFYKFLPDLLPLPTSLNPVLYIQRPLLDYAFDLYHLEGQHQFEMSPAQRLVVGADYRMTDIRGDLINGRHQIQFWGGYLQEEWTPLEPLTLILGGRYDYYDFQIRREDFISPRISLLYRISPLHQLFRFSYGEAYRPPTPLEEFAQGIILSNPDLNPEKIVSYEAGYSALFFDQLKTGVNLYYNRISDLIDIQGNPVSNLTGAKIYGGEIEGELLLTRKLRFFANYAYQEIYQPFEVIPLIYNSAIRAGPTQKINAGGKLNLTNGFFIQMQLHYLTRVQFQTTNLVGATGLFHVLPNDTPPYTLVNLQVGYKLWHDKMELTLSFFNLLHDVHREYPLGDEIGSRLVCQLNLNLD